MSALNGIKKSEVHSSSYDYDRSKNLSTDNDSDVSDASELGDEYEMESSDQDLEGLQSKGSGSFSPLGADEIEDGGPFEDSEEMDDGIPQQIKSLKQQINGNDKIDDQTKELLLEKLNDASSIRSISADQAQEKLDDLAEEVQNYSMYSPAAMRLNKELGIEDPAAVQEMLDRHGIKGDSPDLDPAKLADLLEDPMVADAVSAQQEAYSAAYKTMNDMIPAKATEAHAVNQATDTKDTSTVMDTDTSSFQWLYETAIGTSKEAKDVFTTANALAEKKASILSALTGQKVEVDAKNPGMIELPGGKFNAITNREGANGPAMEWPRIEAIPFHADLEGDGQTTFPDWMKEAQYPYTSVDDGGWNPWSIAVVAGGVYALAAVGIGVGAAQAAGASAPLGSLMSYEPESPY